MMVDRAALELLERRLQQQKRQEIKLRRVQLFVGVMVMGAEGENRTSVGQMAAFTCVPTEANKCEQQASIIDYVIAVPGPLGCNGAQWGCT